MNLNPDKMVLKKMREILPIAIIKDLFRDIDISRQDFRIEYGFVLDGYLKWTTSADSSFINSKLEKHRVEFNDNLRKYKKLLSENTDFESGQRCLLSIELRLKDTIKFKDVVGTLNNLSLKIFSNYRKIVRYGKRIRNNLLKGSKVNLLIYSKKKCVELKVELLLYFDILLKSYYRFIIYIKI